MYARRMRTRTIIGRGIKIEIGLDFDFYYRCPECRAKSEEPGKCPECNVEKVESGNMEFFEDAVTGLRERFGTDKVLIRKSSSGNGYHVRVIGTNLTPEDELQIRKSLNDCKGRQISDMGRLKGGLNTSRLFTYKSRTTFNKGFDKIHKQKVRKAGNWHD